MKSFTKCRICQKEVYQRPSRPRTVCSRACYYKHQKLVIPKGEKSHAWKGDRVGDAALHDWVEKNLGAPRKCEHCRTTKAKVYHWANRSQEYKRDLKDWLRLCVRCHTKYDYPTRYMKWRESVKKIGWHVKEIAQLLGANETLK